MDILYKRGYVEYHGSLNANVYIATDGTLFPCYFPVGI